MSQLDSLVDGEKIRNRSHAIEYLLGRTLSVGSTKALILAGGQGVKLRPFTYEMPKVMLPIRGKPLLEHTINSLRQAGVVDIIIAVDYLADKVEGYFKDGSHLGVNIHYIKCKKGSRGTAEPFRAAQDLVGPEPFILHYGDVLAKIDYLDLLGFHQSQKHLATMALTSVMDSSVWGVVGLRGSKVISFNEKPGGGAEDLSHLINAGIYVLSKDVYKYLSRDSISLEKELFPKLAKAGELYGYPFEGDWYDVGTAETYEKALKNWIK